MKDHQLEIPACFSSGEKPSNDPKAVTRRGHSVFQSVFRVKVANQSRLITITWFKNLMLHGLSVSVSGLQPENDQCTCKVAIKPWYFWRKQGSKRFIIEGNKRIDVHWDLKKAKFNGETEPISDYYVAVLCNKEVVLFLGDLNKVAYKRTGCKPASVDPILVLRKERVFGKKRFCTRVKFHEKGRFHGVSIECKNRNSDTNGGSEPEPEMEIRVDGHLVIHVKHLQWKFRGNESIHVSKYRVEVYWDVHDWLFNPVLTHALFVFKPFVSSASPSSFSTSSSSTLSSQTGTSSSRDGLNSDMSSEFSSFLYAWKIE